MALVAFARRSARHSARRVLCLPVVTNYRLSKSVGTAYGQRRATGAGALIHETTEQLEKAKDGLNPGEVSKDPNASIRTSPEFKKDHATTTTAENSVNGNIRTGNNTYAEKNGTTTFQTR